jgi:hypothetical protein
MRYTYFRKPQPEFTMCPSWLSSSGVVGWLNDWIYLVLLSGVKLDQLPLFSGHRGTSKHHVFFLMSIPTLLGRWHTSHPHLGHIC